MARVRRTRYLVVCCQDSTVPDIAALLCGVARVVSVEDTYAISILRGEKHIIAPDEVQLLLSVPSNRWVDGDGMDRAALDRLRGGGVFVRGDAGGGPTALG